MFKGFRDSMVGADNACECYTLLPAMSDKPLILFVAIIPSDYSPYLASEYGMERTFDLMPHKLAILMLSAWLRQEGCEADYIWINAPDSEGFRIVEEAVEGIKPDALGFSLVTEEVMLNYRLIEHLKKKYPEILVIVGGPHVTAMPEHTLTNFPAIDFVSVGEGEKTLTELLKKISNGAGKEEFENIPGLAFRTDDGRIVNTGARVCIEDINVLPDPAYDLLFKPGTLPDKKTAFPLVCSYGCYFHCTFCSVPHGHYRALDPVRVVDRIERINRQYGVEYFAIRDSFWPPKRGWLDKFCDEVEKRKLKISFHFQTRAGTCTLEQFERLKRIGAKATAIGVEAGNPEVLKRIRKSITLNMAKRTMSDLNKAGIFSIAFFIFGNQGETRRTIQESIDFSRELNSSIAFYHVLYPLPGAEAFRSVPDGQKNWWMGGELPSICDLPVGELEKLARESFLRYPLRSAYLKQHIIGGKLAPEFRSIARRIYIVHLRKYLLGMAERSAFLRMIIRGVKRMTGRS